MREEYNALECAIRNLLKAQVKCELAHLDCDTEDYLEALHYRKLDDILDEVCNVLDKATQEYIAWVQKELARKETL